MTYAVDWRRCDTAGAGLRHDRRHGHVVRGHRARPGRPDARLRDGVERGRRLDRRHPAVRRRRLRAAREPAGAGGHRDAACGLDADCCPGDWVEAASYGYRWWRCVGIDVRLRRRRDRPDFELRATDAGATFRAVVTATNPSGSSTAHSDATDVVTARVAAPGAARRSRCRVAPPVAGGTFTARIALRRSDGVGA